MPYFWLLKKLMLFKIFMKIDNILIVFSLILIFVISCTNIEPTNTADSCIIFNEKKSWYKATKKSYDKWNAPIAFFRWVSLGFVWTSEKIDDSKSAESKTNCAFWANGSFRIKLSVISSGR